MLNTDEPHRILLVDSQVIFRKGLSALLGQFSDIAVVGEAADSDAALDRVRDLDPDVILLNSQILEGGLVEDITRLRLALPAARVIILASSHTGPRVIYEAIRAGACGYIALDREIDDLIKAIRMAIAGHAILTLDALTSLIDHLSQLKAGAPLSQPADPLTARERDVLMLISQGITNREIAKCLFISESTVRSHVHNILSKLQLTNRVQAAAFALADQIAILPRPDGLQTLPAGTTSDS